MNRVLLHCRPGFEAEVCAEITEQANLLDCAGYAKAKAGSAFAEFVCPDVNELSNLKKSLSFSKLIFPRQCIYGFWLGLPQAHRIEILVEQLTQDQQEFGSLWLEVLDTNEGKEVSAFCRKFEAPLRKALIKAQLLTPSDQLKKPRLILLFLSSREVFVGQVQTDNSAVWPMGVPRLKFPRQAPSRSTLKLEEAWHQFIPRTDWNTRLAPGMSAVDLGAAPGGWTWQLVNRHMRVTAVDNGPMNAELMDSGLVEHLRADGFSFRPKKPVHWMVCDIVEKPARNAALLERWIAEGWCQEAIVNLKLPMKQRYSEVKHLLGRIQERLHQQNLKFELSCKQLYHDREEVTCHLRRY